MLTANKKDLFEKENDFALVVSDSCQLRILSVDDVSDEYVAWMNDYEVVKYTEQRFSPHSREDVKTFVAEKFRSPSDILFGIFFENQHIGNIKLGPINWKHETGEVSYFIGNKDFWGKGLATSVVRSVVEFALDRLDLKKINAGYYENNVGSARVLEKCGFLVEGVRKKNVIFEGERVSLIIVGRTST